MQTKPPFGVPATGRDLRPGPEPLCRMSPATPFDPVPPERTMPESPLLSCGTSPVALERVARRAPSGRSDCPDLLAPHPLRQRLLAHIDAQIDNPALTPQEAARALGISVRGVHGLLAGMPHSFSRLVARRRLQRARELLAQPGRSVVDVAFACGFNSLATFYRQHAAAFGTSPAARRHRDAPSLEAMTRPEAPCTR